MPILPFPITALRAGACAAGLVLAVLAAPPLRAQTTASPPSAATQTEPDAPPAPDTAAPGQAPALSLGVYLWTNPDADPLRSQFLSIADDNAEMEIDSPDGTKSDSHPARAEEMRLLTAAVKAQIAGISLDATPAPPAPYITVDWHMSTGTSTADGSATYPLTAVPKEVVALQKAAFGGLYDGEKAGP